MIAAERRAIICPQSMRRARSCPRRGRCCRSRALRAKGGYWS